MCQICPSVAFATEERGRGHLGYRKARRESGAEHGDTSTRELRPFVLRFSGICNRLRFLQVVAFEAIDEERAVIDVVARLLRGTGFQFEGGAFRKVSTTILEKPGSRFVCTYTGSA